MPLDKIDQEFLMKEISGVLTFDGIRLEEREFSIGVIPQGFDHPVINIDRPHCGWTKDKKFAAAVNWSAIGAQTPKKAAAVGAALIYAAKKAQLLQRAFDKGQISYAGCSDPRQAVAQEKK